MERYTLIWSLIRKDNDIPKLGFECDVSLDYCYKRIGNIWKGYGYSIDNPPVVWAYEIKDRHGRIIDVDQWSNGKWMTKADETVCYPS